MYYSKGFDGVGRPSIETESEVESLQKAQYGYRNDAWLAVDDVVGEVAFLQKNGYDSEDDLLELRQAVRRANEAFAAYIALAPATDVETAKRLAKRQ